MSETKNVIKKKIDKKTIKQQVLTAFYMAMRRLTQTVLVCVIILIIAVAALWLRLQAGPLNMDFAKDGIQSAINQQIQPYNVELGTIELIWLNVQDPFLIAAKDIQIFENSKTVTTVKDVQIGLSAVELSKAKVRPSFLKIKNPEIKLSYVEDEITLCCEDALSKKFQTRDVIDDTAEKALDVSRKPKGLPIRVIRKNIQTILDNILTDNLSGPYLFFQALDKVELNAASLFVVQDGAPEKLLGKFDLRLEESVGNLVGDLKVVLKEDNSQSELNTEIIYRGDLRDLTFTGKLKEFESQALNKFFIKNEFFKRQNFQVSGDVQAAFNSELKLSMAQLNISIPDANFVFKDDTIKNVDIKDVTLKGYYNREKNTLNVESMKGNIESIPISLKALGTIDQDKITFPVEMNIPSVSMKNINDIIPSLENKSNGLSWLKYKLTDGSLNDVSASFDLYIVRNMNIDKRAISANNIKASLGFDDMTVRYSDTLLPATNSKGTALYENDTLIIKATAAKIKEIQANSVTVNIVNLTKAGAGKAEINIDAQGGVKSILNYLSSEPIKIGKNLGFDVDSVKGDAKAKVKINFPTKRNIKANDFTVSVDGVIDNLLIPNIVKNLPISGGPYSLKYLGGKLSLQGSGLFASRPITLDYKQNMKSQTNVIVANITADEGLRKAFGVDLEDYLKGTIPLDITYEKLTKNSILNIKGDLTQTEISIDPIAFKKPANTSGEFSFKGLIEKDSIKEIDGLRVQASGLNLNGGRLLFGKNNQGDITVNRGSFKEVKLKDNNVSAEFELENDNSLKLLINANYLDAKPFLTTQKVVPNDVGPQKLQAQKISLTVDRLELKNDVISKNTKIYYDRSASGKTNNFEMDAQIGSGKTIIRLKPDAQDGNKKVFVESADAGNFLKGVGVYKNIRGGTLSINGSSLNLKNTDIKGKARIDNFKVKNAPVIAKLINTLSLPGILGLLSNEGLTFDRMESDFEWRFKPNGDLLIVKDGRSSGASLGLTFEGVINRETDITDISGTVIPMSEVNKIIGDIPIIGNILTGGGALLAATYTIKGPTSDPKVSVNPLAALAPGVLRKVIFEEDIEKKIKEAE